MSGGDSSGGWGGIAPADNCMDIHIQVRLSSIDEAVLIAVNIGDKLNIEKNTNSIVATKQGKIVGAIASADVIKLKKCIDDGHKYTGVVTEKDGGKCVINIFPVQ